MKKGNMMELRTTRHALLSSVAILLFVSATSVRAADDSVSVAADENVSGSEIIVTAQKRSERLVDVPQTIKALDAAALARGGVTSINDLGRQTPGLSLTKRQNNTPNVTIRGIGAYGAVLGVGFYIDDVQNLTDQIMKLQDIERVEVLKGPQGTLYGGSSLGGAIRYISKVPKFETSATIQADVGTKDYRNLYGAVNVPVVDDMIAIRLSGYYTHDDGFVRDLRLNKHTSYSTEYGGRAQLLIKPTDELSALFTIKGRRLTSGISYLLQNSVNEPIYTSNYNFLPRQRVNSISGIANISYDFGFASLLSITSIARQHTTSHTDADYSPIVRLEGRLDNLPAKVYTQELRLTSQGSDKIDWIVGAYAQRSRNTLFQTSRLNLTIGGTTRLDPFLNYSTDQKDIAAFGTINYHINDFTLTGGARINRTKFDAASFVVGGRRVDRSLTKKNPTVVIPKFSVAYKPSSDITFYATIAEGYEAGKIDPSVNPINPYKAEIDWTYEIGTKGYLFDRKLYYEIAGYYVRERNRQVQSVIVTGGISVKPITNIGTSTNKGVEASLDWRPTDQLSLNGSVGYLDAVWNKGAIYSGVSVAGKDVPNAPKWAANLGATYEVPLANELELRLHADAAYTGKYEWSLNYVPFSGVNPSQWIAFSRIAIGPKDGRWELAGRIENLFNEKYFNEFTERYAGAQQVDGTCNLCHLGAPGDRRRFTASLLVNF